MIVKSRSGIITKQAASHSWSPSDGFSLHSEWTGLIAAAQDIARQLREANVPYTLSVDAPIATVRADKPNDDGVSEVPVGSWAFNGQTLQKDLFEHETFRGLPEADQELIKNCRNGDFSSKPSETGLTGDSLSFYTMVWQGTLNYVIPHFVLRHVMLCSQSYATSQSGDDLLEIYTTTELLTECATFTDYPLPDLIDAEIDKIEAAKPADPSGYLWGWLKMPAQIQAVARDRIEISQEYWWECWSTTLYTAKT